MKRYSLPFSTRLRTTICGYAFFLRPAASATLSSPASHRSDYARSMAFIAIDKESGEMLGSVRLMGDADHQTGEYAVMVRSDLKGLGLGWMLMKLILAYAEKDGFKEVDGEVLRSNQTMRQMCEALGFETIMDPDDPDLVHMIFKVPDISEKIAKLI